MKRIEIYERAEMPMWNSLQTQLYNDLHPEIRHQVQEGMVLMRSLLRTFFSLVSSKL